MPTNKEKTVRVCRVVFATQTNGSNSFSCQRPVSCFWKHSVLQIASPPKIQTNFSKGSLLLLLLLLRTITASCTRVLGYSKRLHYFWNRPLLFMFLERYRFVTSGRGNTLNITFVPPVVLLFRCRQNHVRN